MSNVTKFFLFLGATIFALLLLRWTGLLVFDVRQILSIGIFCMFIYGTLLFGEFRLAFAFGGIALLMTFGLLTVERFTQSASLDVLVFLIGTFLVIGFLEEAQFFEHVISGIVGAVGPRPQRLLFVLMMLSAISSALVDEVTAILFMSGTMLHLTSKYKIRPAPFIIMLVFACNTGSAMSSVGNPIGVMIALKTGLGFTEFLKYSAPVALVTVFVVYLICRWYFAEEIADFSEAVHTEFEVRQGRIKEKHPVLSGLPASMQGPGESGALAMEGGVVTSEPVAEENPLGKDFFAEGPSDTVEGLTTGTTYRLCWGLLLGLVTLLITHRLTESLLGLREGTMMIAAALIMASIVLMIRRERARELLERRVDWWTLSFFMMLFASVGTLQDTKVTEVLAEKLSSQGASQMMTIQIIGWATGWLSAFLDNVLAVATFMPVVHDIRVKAGVPFSSNIYWFMLFGGTFMGNMTIIGSTANIVATGLLERRGHGTIGFGYWMKIGFIVSIISMLVATALLILMSHLPGALQVPMLPVPEAAH